MSFGTILIVPLARVAKTAGSGTVSALPIGRFPVSSNSRGEIYMLCWRCGDL